MSAALSERVGKVTMCPPLPEVGEQQRREFRAVLDADALRACLGSQRS